MPDEPLISLRKSIRQNIKTVMDFIDHNYLTRENDKTVKPDSLICMFCGSVGPITKEHILPRWTFQNDTERFFNITLNGQSQTYNKSTIPACAKCNSVLLNYLERKIQVLFTTADPKNVEFTSQDAQNIIRWLEIIDYKFHIMNISNRFLNLKNANHIPYLKNLPLYMLLPNKDYSPSRVLTEIRKILYRLSIKDKKLSLNSLVIFKTSNKSDHFFHTLNDFIFLELAKYGIAIFYFYSKSFKNSEMAYKAAMKIVKEVY
ncbi:hypothetical protein [Pedobacter sp. Hv1]|uniref:hypothetical protein n=1 Tax=Pedobacter sp. Hv1 TaxID=1740090 RepID=UPI0006D8B628|nr:hypothetical protein [Pedobacter sp. Hv1]KQB99198.1 hypothetical protein AQF98_16600 [Pedobacter sp. Hv1]